MTQGCDGCYEARRLFESSYQSAISGAYSQAGDNFKDGLLKVVGVAIAEPLSKAGIKFSDILKKIKD